ncbi:peptide methionine sulfoxide reductase MsrA [Terfezia claveryi]|nr:peptide methionine sulfoxide reductase MsrA [Terfezia claveryi]
MGSSISPPSFAPGTPIGSNLASPTPPTAKTAYFAAGCFWGVESTFRRRFPPLTSGLLDTRVGYIGGNIPSPTYRAVCTGVTGHAEALEVLYDPAKLRYEELVEFFFRMHDPSDKGGQGPDRGSQYRSAIFTNSANEERVAREIRRRVEERWYKGGEIATEVVGKGKWWGAEEYHQVYLDKNPDGYECPSHFVRNFQTVLDTPIDGADEVAAELPKPESKV